MTTNILCYGDSNTYGYIAGTFNAELGIAERFPKTVRWTGVLQSLLGDSFEVIEEGLSGRTTVLDEPGKPERNGKTYLLPCLQSHTPIDLIVLALGTNDLKVIFDRSPQDIVDGISELLDIIKNSHCGVKNYQPEVLLLIPPALGENSQQEERFYGMFSKTLEKSVELVDVYEAFARDCGLPYIKLSEVVSLEGGDGIHYSEAEHEQIARAVGKEVLKLVN